MKTLKGSPSAPRAQRWLSSLFQVFASCMQLRFRKKCISDISNTISQLCFNTISQSDNSTRQPLLSIALLTALYQVIFLRLYVHMNQHETFAHRVRSSSKSQGATPKRSETVPSAFLHLLSGILCHPVSKILLPFRCLSPDSKLFYPSAV